MHEEWLVRTLFARVTSAARLYRSARVIRISLQLGELSGVEAHGFARVFEAAAKPDSCKDAELEVRVTPALWECRRCRRPFSRGEVLRCDRCRGHAHLVQGHDVLLNRIEVEMQDDALDQAIVSVEIHESLLGDNLLRARENREAFNADGLFVVNLLGPPHAGKVALLERLAKATGHLRIATLAGDVERGSDAQRLRDVGMDVIPIGGEWPCHLDAAAVHEAMREVDWGRLDVLLIDNVGNLTCPAMFDLGQHVNLIVLSVTDGEDTPLKYPATFRKADLVVITKMDLLGEVEMRIDRVEDALARVAPHAHVLTVCAKTGQGVDALAAWLQERRALTAARLAQPPRARHGVSATR